MQVRARYRSPTHTHSLTRSAVACLQERSQGDSDFNIIDSPGDECMGSFVMAPVLVGRIHPKGERSTLPTTDRPGLLFVSIVNSCHARLSGL